MDQQENQQESLCHEVSSWWGPGYIGWWASCRPSGNRGQLTAASPTTINAFCVTLYNESELLLNQTLRAILAAIAYFQRRSAVGGARSAICVIADGYEHLDRDNLRLLGKCGALDEYVDFSSSGEAYSERVLDCASLLRKLGARECDVRHVDADGIAVHVLVCIKARNRGKLDSHRVFFNAVCATLNPKYCYQVDTGSTLSVDSVLRMVERMEADPRVAAVAPRVLPPAPSDDAGFLSIWQFLDLALQRAILWPFEVLTGHLSVIPGQACALRWEAINGNPVRDMRYSAGTPLRRYLQGSAGEGALEKMMYLAEDRVLGSELALASGRQWRVSYDAGAAVLTDACETLDELLRQRRRWRNSALACRVWLARQYPHLIGRADRDLRAKVTFSLGVGAQVLLIVREFLIPTQLAGVILLIGRVLVRSTSLASIVLETAFIAALAIDVAWRFARRSTKRKIEGKSRRHLIRLAGLVTTILFLAWIFNALPPAAALLLATAPGLALLAAALSLPKAVLDALTRITVYPIAMLGMLCLLAWYAYCNMADISWGTKGLLATELSSGLAGRLRRIRNRVLGWWIGLNAILVAGLGWNALHSAEVVNPAILWGAIFDAGIALIAVIAHLMERCRNRHRVSRRQLKVL